MFEAGLTYVKADFHLHTHKDKEFKYSGEDNSFVKDYVAGLKNAGVGIGVITNHNKFDKDEYVAIRKAAKKDNIFILPGVELSVKEGANGVHTLIVFNPDEWLSNGEDHIQSFLATAFASIPNHENANAKCNFDLRNTIEKLDAYGRDYFIVFAHVDQNSGLFSECSGGLLYSLAGIASFHRRVLALQKAVVKKNIDQFETIFKYSPALVEGSDPKSISEIGTGNRYTFLKIGDFSYAAVKFAMQDHTGRVFNKVPDIKHGYIKSISFQGGKLDGQTIAFSPELNTLIGIRGSGKSAVLEIIRYILMLNPQADKDYKESLVGNVLGSGGKATLHLSDKHGKMYSVSRIYGERSTVVDANGNDLAVTPIGLCDGVQYFGQKDLSNSADHENGLLEKLVSGKISQPVLLNNCIHDLKEAITQLLDVSKIPEQIAEAQTNLAETKHKISIFEEKGVAEKLKKQAAYITDQAKLENAKKTITNVVTSLSAAYRVHTSVSSALQDHKSDYNEKLITETQEILLLVDQQMSIIGNAITQIRTYESAADNIVQRLAADITALADEFAEIKREIRDETLNADTFVQLTGDLTKITERLKELGENAQSKSSIESAFMKASRQRNEMLQQLFQEYQTEIARINSAQSELRIEITFKGDKEGFKAKLKSDFRGSGISEAKYQTLSESFTDYVDIIEDWLLGNGTRLQSILSLSEYGKFSEKLKEQYNELLDYQVQNSVEIYYHEKPLKQHSIGQRASALILFILTQNDNDIILIDQPEDDLDNKVIYDEVISTIAKMKSNLQFIFATHNANIPVLGDAERILVADYQDKRIDIMQGNIDLAESHKQIVDIMEGGKTAFERRQLIYEAWR